MSNRVRFNMQPDSAPSPRRGRRAARSRATPQNTDDVGEAQLAANSPYLGGFSNGLFTGNQPPPVYPLPGLSSTTAIGNSPWFGGSFGAGLNDTLRNQGNVAPAGVPTNPPYLDASGIEVPDTSAHNTTNPTAGITAPGLVPFGSGLGFKSNEPPFDPKCFATMDELDEDMRRYPGTSREWLNNRAKYFQDEVYKARKAGRREPARVLVKSVQELNDPNDRYSGSRYVDDPPQFATNLVDMAFNRPQRGRETRRATVPDDDNGSLFVDPYIQMDGTRHGRETRAPGPEIPALDPNYEYIPSSSRHHRIRRQRSPSSSLSSTSSSTSTTSSSSISSSDPRYKEGLQNFNNFRRIWVEQLSVPLTRIHKNDIRRSMTPETMVTFSRLAMGNRWARTISLGVSFLRDTGFQVPGADARGIDTFENFLKARNLTSGERIDLEMIVEDLKEMFGEE